MLLPHKEISHYHMRVLELASKDTKNEARETDKNPNYRGNKVWEIKNTIKFLNALTEKEKFELSFAAHVNQYCPVSPVILLSQCKHLRVRLLLF